MPKAKPFYFTISDDALSTANVGSLMEMMRYDQARVYETENLTGFIIFSCDNMPHLDRWASFGIPVAAVSKTLDNLRMQTSAWRDQHPTSDRVDAFVSIRERLYEFGMARESSQMIPERMMHFLEELYVRSYLHHYLLREGDADIFTAEILNQFHHREEGDERTLEQCIKDFLDLVMIDESQAQEKAAP
jgi:hypothetical protein